MKKTNLAEALFPEKARGAVRPESRFRDGRRWENDVLALADGRRFRFAPDARLHELRADEKVTITFDRAAGVFVVGRGPRKTR